MALRRRCFACCLDAAAASSVSGSRNHRTALYCRQADSAAACFCVSAWLALVFQRGHLLCSGVICNQLLGCSRRCSRFAISHALRYRFLAICCCHAAGGARSPAVGTTARPYTAGRLPFFVTAVRKSASEVPLRFIDAHRYAPDIVRSQPRTASLLSGNSVLRSNFIWKRVGRLRRGWILCFKDSAPDAREESPQ